jgi:tetratricopeptide (TPR) repeat protein
MLVLLLLVAPVSLLAVYAAWTMATRDQEYGRLVAAGDAALANDQIFVAIESFSGAIALKPDSMLAYLRRGETYRQHGDLDAAARDLRKAAALDPTATRPLERLGDVLYAQERYEPAARRYQAYVRIDDRSPRVSYKLGLARFRSGDHAEAVQALRQAVHLDDRSAEAYYVLGLSLQAARRTNEAVWALQRATSLAPAFAPPREALASLFRTLNRPRERIEQLETLVDMEPARVDRRIALALAQADLGRIEQAITTLSRTAHEQPGAPAVYSTLGSLWLQVAESRGDRIALSKALDATGTLVAMGTPSGDDLFLRGRVLLAAGQTDAALRTLRLATTHLPVTSAAFERLATAATRLGRYAEAREALLRYASLVTDDRKLADAMTRAADCSFRLRERGEAVRWGSRAAEHAPRDTAILLRLARYQLAAGQRADAAATAARLSNLAGETITLDQIASRARPAH